jgi:hypothetical protein
VQHFPGRCIIARGENVDCGSGGDDDGPGDIADAGADDGGSIPRDGRGGPSEGREVKREDVENREGYLIELSLGIDRALAGSPAWEIR